MPWGGLALAAVLAAVVLGHEGRRVAQVLLLGLPALLWLRWPGRRLAMRALQVAVAALVGLSFIADGAARGFVLEAYGASPASSMVMAALANTSAQESAEFLAMHGPRLLAWMLFATGSLALLVAGLLAWWRWPPPAPGARGWRLLVAGVIATTVAIPVASSSWRGHHPLVFWPRWAGDVASLRQQWGDLGAQRSRLQEAARQQPPAATPASPETMVLVISDSINRRHMSLYGYPRDTTPGLMALQRQEAPRLRVFRHAWSVDASTVPALRNFFHLGQRDEPRQHLLALAAQAGYRVWWIGNHDDLAVDQEHARLADQVHILNRMPGRSSASLDQDVLPLMEQALQHPAPRKLLVLHLLGAHPHYKLRYPPWQAPFHQVSDDVYQGMKAQGRSAWVRKMRNEYDAALRYHDSVVSRTLDITRRLGGKAVWVYFSDHGQELGWETDHAGHSPSTAEGYRIPLLVWGAGVEGVPDRRESVAARSDWLGHSVLRLLGLDWAGYRPDRDVLDPHYRWVEPDLPLRKRLAS